MKNPKLIDDHIREKIGSFEPAFQESHWKLLRKSMPIHKRLFRSNYFKMAFMAFLIGMSFFVYKTILKPNNTNDQIVNKGEVFLAESLPASLNEIQKEKEIKLFETADEVEIKSENVLTQNKTIVQNQIKSKVEKLDEISMKNGKQKNLKVYKNDQHSVSLPGLSSYEPNLQNTTQQSEFAENEDKTLISLTDNEVEVNEAEVETELIEVEEILDPIEEKVNNHKVSQSILAYIERNISTGFYLNSSAHTLKSNKTFEGYLQQDLNSFSVNPGIMVIHKLGKRDDLRIGFFVSQTQFRIDYNGLVGQSSNSLSHTDYSFSVLEIPIGYVHDVVETDNFEIRISPSINFNMMFGSSENTWSNDGSITYSPFTNYTGIQVFPQVSVPLSFYFTPKISFDIEPFVRLNFNKGIIEGTNPKYNFIESSLFLSGSYLGFKYNF